MTTTPQTEAEQDVPLPDGFIMDGLPDGRIEYKRGFLRESDSLLRSCAPAWEARSIYRLHKELRRLDTENRQLREQLERASNPHFDGRLDNWQAACGKARGERDQLRAQVETMKIDLAEVCDLGAKAEGALGVSRGMVRHLQQEINQLRAHLAKAVAEEREACALECESRQANGNRAHTHPDECASAIRARSNT